MDDFWHDFYVVMRGFAHAIIVFLMIAAVLSVCWFLFGLAFELMLRGIRELQSIR